tara:strand:- start:153 stop:308 length:156 start_codon:yes stop_codon:yes gene_type:complete
MDKKFITMNLANGAIQLVVAKSYWKAMDKARVMFGDSRVKVWEDGLSSRLS